MDEYISKQAAFVTLVFSDAMGDMTCGQMAKVLDVIKTVPTADVAPVVRCRDCKHWKFDHTCREHSLVSPMGAEEFCSRGECKDRHEGSMRMMGEKAHKALNDYWSWIDAYMRGEADE